MQLTLPPEGCSEVLAFFHGIDRADHDLSFKTGKTGNSQMEIPERDCKDNDIGLIDDSLVALPAQGAFRPRCFNVSIQLSQVASAFSFSREPTTTSKIGERRIAIPSPISPVPPTIPIFTLIPPAASTVFQGLPHP